MMGRALGGSPGQHVELNSVRVDTDVNTDLDRRAKFDT